MSTIANRLRTMMTLDPVRVEIVCGGAEYTWQQLAEAVATVEAALDAAATPLDARVGIALRNRPMHVAALTAVLASGRCLVTLNPALPDEALRADVAKLGLAAVIGEPADLARIGPGTYGATRVELAPGLEGASLASAGEAASIRSSPDIAVEMLTSGTTGAPKRVPLTRAAFEASLGGVASYERDGQTDGPPRLATGCAVIAAPLTHIGGLFQCVGALAAGRRIALLARFTVDGWVAAIRRHRPAAAPIVPAALRMVLDAGVDREALSSLRMLSCGTAPLTPELVDAFFEAYRIPVCANYGATEMAGPVAGWTLDDFRAHWKDKRGAAGRLHAGVEARVVDGESGAVLPLGEEGLLELRGAQLGNADAWLRTTDRAVLDTDRFLFIMGRADGAIVRGGFKVHPEDVVAQLLRHPAIADAAVVGIPSRRLGEVPVAAIVLKPGASAPALVELDAHLRGRLIAYQLPRHYRFVPGLPRTASLKPSTPGVRALFAEHVEERQRLRPPSEAKA